MYGLVNQAVEDLIRAEHGEATWQAIKGRAGVDAPAFISMSPYPDAVTYRLVGAASEVLAVPVPALLEAFGEYWILYTARKGYGHLLTLAGTSFPEFVQQLDQLHAHVALSFTELRPPTFWCTEVGERSLRLHYRSSREGLAPMVIGLLRGLGTMFDTAVTVTHVASPGQGADHDEFQIAFLPPPA